ncbi:hypothetical protein FA95DRAFT_613472 [Auriscalpium vulgare]|uniref:Uncharacterized protein n=1 Tax=Auriscalpium vulgare TaxID=40419 RepID=A0ACB8REV2_9AGAM|nr:hypothetical protein FA95DRAFT_613472 [Auriscalpium vulgare]
MTLPPCALTALRSSIPSRTPTTALNIIAPISSAVAHAPTSQDDFGKLPRSCLGKGLQAVFRSSARLFVLAQSSRLRPIARPHSPTRRGFTASPQKRSGRRAREEKRNPAGRAEVSRCNATLLPPPRARSRENLAHRLFRRVARRRIEQEGAHLAVLSSVENECGTPSSTQVRPARPIDEQ